MGLLGGFKGKLFRKEKKTKKQEVVCVHIKTFSEFDDIAVPSTSNGNVGALNVVRERRKSSKPDVQNIFGLKSDEAPKIFEKVSPAKTPTSNSVKKQAPSIKTPEVIQIRPKNDSDDHKKLINNSHDNRNFRINTTGTSSKIDDDIRSKRAPPSFTAENDDGNFKINIVDNHAKTEEFEESGNFKISSKQIPTIPKRGPPPFIDSDDEDDYDGGNFKIGVVNNSVKIEDEETGNFKINIVGATEKRGPPPFIDSDEDSDSDSSSENDENVVPRAESPFLEDDNDDGNFKINIVNTPKEDQDNDYKVHVNQTFGSVSEEESEEEEEEKVTPVNYSSQAASIFFGGEEEPTVSRPRNIVFNEDEDGNSSDGSASA